MEKVIALDTMIFIYLLEGDKRFWGEVESLFERINKGEVKALTSVVSVIEVLSPVKLLEKDSVRIEIGRFFRETSGLSVVPVDMEIGELAAKLRRKNRNLRTPDAIQLATAVVGGAKTFYTNDIKLKKIKIASLSIKMLGK